MRDGESRYKIIDASGKYWKTTSLSDSWVGMMRRKKGIKAKFIKVSPLKKRRRVSRGGGFGLPSGLFRGL